MRRAFSLLLLLSSVGAIAHAPMGFQIRYWRSLEQKFEVSKVHSKERLIHQIETVIREFTRSSYSMLDNIIRRPYLVERTSKYWMDYLIDTPDGLLSQKNMTYSLRYRWGRREWGFWHRYLNFIPQFFPDRCDIFFSIGLADTKRGGWIEEVLLHFDNGRTPFSEKLDAPLSPFDSKALLEAALSGSFREKIHLPYSKVAESLLDNFSLSPHSKEYREQIRWDLIIPNYPFSEDLNENRVAVVVLEKISSDGRSVPFYRIRVQGEPGTFSTVKKIRKIQQTMNDRPILDDMLVVGYEMAFQAQQALIKDLEQLGRLIATAVIGPYVLSHDG